MKYTKKEIRVEIDCAKSVGGNWETMDRRILDVVARVTAEAEAEYMHTSLSRRDLKSLIIDRVQKILNG